MPALGLALGLSRGQRSAGPPPPTPDTPAYFTATPGDGQVSLAWDLAAHASRYPIYVNTVDDRPSATLLATPSGHTYLHTGATNDQEYFYWLAAQNVSGTSAETEANATPTHPAPDAPTSFSVVNVDFDRVLLGWTILPGLTYKILKGTDSNIANASVDSSGLDSQPASALGSYAATYWYWLIANDGIKDSAPAGPLTATLDYHTPRTVTGIVETVNTGGFITISYDDVREYTGVEVFDYTYSINGSPAGSGTPAGYATINLNGTPGDSYQITITVRNPVTGVSGTPADRTGTFS